MSPEDSYNKLKKEYGAMDPAIFIKPIGTPAEILADGNNQLAVARIDQAKLVSEGMPTTLIAETDDSLMAYSWAKGLADTSVAQKSSDESQWNMARDTGYAVRKQLFKYGKFGCELNGLTEVRKTLGGIIANQGDDDMILDLLLAHQLFTAHPEMTKGLTQFNPAWIDDALMCHNELKQLQGAVNNPAQAAVSEKLNFEARAAYTIYHKKVGLIREWGQFVFEGEERANAYKAIYMVERAEVARKNMEKEKAAPDQLFE